MAKGWFRKDASNRRALPALRNLAEASQVALVRCSRDLIYVAANDAYANLIGRTPGEITGKPIPEVIGREAFEAIRPYIARVLAGETIEYEVRLPLPGGTRVVHCSYVPDVDRSGEIVGYVASIIDITQRASAEERLRESESTLRSFYTSSPFLMGVVEVSDDDLELVHVYDNPATERFFGGDQTSGKSARALGATPEIIALWIRQYRQAERTGAPVEFEYVHPGVQGDVWLRVIVSLIGSAGAGMTRFSYIAEDITYRKHADEELRLADRRKDEFLAILAHELRNPLAPIRSAVELMKLKDHPDPVTRSAREMIDYQVRHMVRLIDDLLDVGRITRGKFELRREQTDLAPLLRQAVDSVRAQCEQFEHSLSLQLLDEPLHVNGDPIRLVQIFTNLLDNACKYSTRNGRIAVEAAVEQGEICVSVRDSGIGIEPQMLARIFDMFSQVDHRPERSQGGLGIGLALVRNLVELHDGQIEARSAGLGRGSEFVVRFPSATHQAGPIQRDAEPAGEYSVEGRAILIVDDNREAADSLMALLDVMGANAEAAYGGVEGIGKAQELRPEIMLLDIGMPEMNGYEVCRQIRASPWGTEILVVALTGWGQESDRQSSVDAGFDAHMVKPVDVDSLLSTLAAHERGRIAPAEPRFAAGTSSQL